MSTTHITNGSSLEDCFTNFFALADLVNIKWKRLQYTGTQGSDPLECPVLVSYSRCLAKDMLCAWRRVGNRSTGEEHSQKNYTKELWCFWFDGEPEWKQLLHHDLMETEQGNWEHSLDYVCRTQLFKALHNLIEKSLYSKGFVRLGKCFVMPLEYQQNVQQDCNGSSNSSNSRGNISAQFAISDSSLNFNPLNPQFSKNFHQLPFIENANQLSFSFTFFIHGESTACANVDIRQRMSIYKLTRAHLNFAQTTQTGLNVILGPYGLAGVLTGQNFKETDTSVQKLLCDWRKFYPVIENISKEKSQTHSKSNLSSASAYHHHHLDPIEDFCGSTSNVSSDSILPPVIEIIVAGVKMKYPSCFVYLVGEEARLLPSVKVSQRKANASASSEQHARIIPDTSSKDESDFSISAEVSDLHNLQRLPYFSPRQPHLPSLSFSIRNIVAQEVNNDQSRSVQAETSAELNEDVANAFTKWNIHDPTSKCGCVCFRCKSRRKEAAAAKAASTVGTGNTPPKKGEKQNEKENKYSSNTGKQKQLYQVPFHRRIFGGSGSQMAFEFDANCDFVETPLHNLTNSNKSGRRTPNSHSPIVPYESPRSMLNGTDSVEPASVQRLVGESPAPDANGSSSAAPTPQANGKDGSKIDIDMISPLSNGRQSIGSPHSIQWTPGECSGGPLTGASMTGNLCTPVNPDICTPASMDCGLPGSVDSVSVAQSNLVNRSYSRRNGIESRWMYSAAGIKRPLLLPKQPNEWEEILGKENRYDLFYDFSCFNTLQDLEPPSKNRRILHRLIRPTSEQADCQDRSISIATSHFSSDPYDISEFDEECGRRKALNNYQSVLPPTPANDYNGDASSPKAPMSVASVRDNDQLLENCEESSDQHKSKTELESKLDSDYLPNSTGSVSLAELSRMFPTPPSYEPNAHSSYSDTTFGGPNSVLNSPENVEKKETVGVYSPPLHTKFIFSPKYEPLPNIPSMAPAKLPFQYRYKPREASGMVAAVQGQNQPKNNNDASHVNADKTKDTCKGANTCDSNNINDSNSGDDAISMPNMPSQPGQRNTNARIFVNGSNSNSMDSISPNLASNTSKSNSSLLYGNNSQMLPEINSLLVNLVLSDSLLNVFKDHNFESCTYCCCNVNVKGSDIEVYLPDILVKSESQYKCICGFSALSNRYLSFFSGLFFEDELEITGICYDPQERLQKPSLFATKQQPEQLDESKQTSSDIKATGATELSESKDRAQGSSMTDVSESLNPKMLELIKDQCNTLFSSSTLFSKSLQFEQFKERQPANKTKSSSLLNLEDNSKNLVKHSTQTTDPMVPILLNGSSLVSKQVFLQNCNALLRSDYCEIAFLALLLGRQGLECWPSKSTLAQYAKLHDVRFRKQSSVHEWLFVNGRLANNTNQEIRCLRRLHGLLMEGSPLSKCMNNALPHDSKQTTVAPLNWRQFFKLAGRSEDQCEPQPIPSLLVAHDRDWVALSPFALKYWEKLMLEPYSFSRDISYIVICPDNNYILQNVKHFFKELSSTYQMLRLGRHRPITKVLNEGVMRVGKATKKITNEPVSEWFNKIGNDQIATKLKMYAQACRHYVAPQLISMYQDRSLLETPNSHSFNGYSNSSQLASTFGPNSAHLFNSTIPSGVRSPAAEQLANGETKPEDGNQDNTTGGAQAASSASITSNAAGPNAHDVFDFDDDSRQPHILIYIVEPFTFTNLNEQTYRFAAHGLLRCYLELLEALPEQLRHHVNVQIISLDSIISNGRDNADCAPHEKFRALSFSVFNQCRKIQAQQPLCKSLTGFGLASSLETFLRSKDANLFSLFKLYMPPFILAPLKDKQTQLGEMFGDRRERSQVLFVSYCLTEDQRYIVASCSNERGDLLENNVINIAIPNRPRRKNARILKFGLEKLMQFILSVMSQSIQPWRLVIGKLGRVGHGELLAWNSLLSKKQLLEYSEKLRERCQQCSYMTPFDTPCILSACLTCLEADTKLRVFADQYHKNTSPNVQIQQCPLSTPEEASCTHILVFPISSNTQGSQRAIEPLGNSITEGIGNDFLDIENMEIPDMDGDLGGEVDFFDIDSPGRDHVFGQLDSPTEQNNEFENLEGNRDGQNSGPPAQPLALGYYVSTAKTGTLPRWFWTACPHLEHCNPSFLKAALMVNTYSVQQINDGNIRNLHPLDNKTTDVLRYVLEGYNSLSWLALDPDTHDRRSCLPIHIQMLLQLYFTVQALT